jgi:mono/diheme cytochrome c family protein
MSALRDWMARPDMRKLMLGFAATAVSAAVGTAGCGLFQSKEVARGHELYAHYCMHCHGEHGRQNEGFNWSSMPDPRPKDLSNKSEMGTFKDEEIFGTISRAMKDTSPEGGEKIGDDEFAVPTMPTFKYTLSEEEIWAIVAYVRTLHGMKLTFNLEGRKRELQDAVKTAQQKHDEAKKVLEDAEKKASAEAEAKGVDVDDAATAKEQEAYGAAAKELKEAQAALDSFSSRPKHAAVSRPDLTMSPADSAKLAETGKRLYASKYGCNACHRVGADGGIVGPALDRAGFRLNPAWIYRWIKYPQAMKAETRMPNLGLSDADAKAVTMYLATLRAPKPEAPGQPIQKASN